MEISLGKAIDIIIMMIGLGILFTFNTTFFNMAVMGSWAVIDNLRILPPLAMFFGLIAAIAGPELVGKGLGRASAKIV